MRLSFLSGNLEMKTPPRPPTGSDRLSARVRYIGAYVVAFPLDRCLNPGFRDLETQEREPRCCRTGFSLSHVSQTRLVGFCHSRIPTCTTTHRSGVNCRRRPYIRHGPQLLDGEPEFSCQPSFSNRPGRWESKDAHQIGHDVCVCTHTVKGEASRAAPNRTWTIRSCLLSCSKPLSISSSNLWLLITAPRCITTA